MGLPGGQQHALDQIERLLQADDEELSAFFADFAKVAGCSPLPRLERLPGPVRFPWHGAGPEAERLARRPEPASRRSGWDRRPRRAVPVVAAVPAAVLALLCVLVVWIPLPQSRCCAPGRRVGVVQPRHTAVRQPPRMAPGPTVVPGL